MQVFNAGLNTKSARAAQFILATFCQSSAGGNSSLSHLSRAEKKKSAKRKGPREETWGRNFWADSLPEHSQPNPARPTHTPKERMAQTQTRTPTTRTAEEIIVEKCCQQLAEKREFSNKFILHLQGMLFFYYPVRIFFMSLFFLPAHRFCCAARN